jgi:glycosyltransferase involved in cell wall biosynthesis
MRRVTIIATELRGFLPGGGMGTATTFLALALARMGHSVEILLARPADEAIDADWEAQYSQAGIRLRHVPPSRERVEPLHFARPRTVELALRADPPDVVVVQDFAAPAYSALRLRQAGLAFTDTLFVVYCHGTRRWVLDMSRKLWVDDLQHVLAVNILERASLELADVVVSPSAYLVEWMRGQRWRLPEHTHVIPYFTRSGATGEPAPMRREVDAVLQRLAFFGRLEEKKGLTAFAAALNALDRGLLDGVELEFLGKPTATWTPERVEQLLSDQTKRALRSVSFTGELEQRTALERLSRPGTLAVIPSTGDNSPNTVYECLERGIPFIAGNAGGIPELVSPNDRADVLCEPTPDGIAAALRPILSGERPLRTSHPAFDGVVSYQEWADVIDMRPRPSVAAVADTSADVVVVERGSQMSLRKGNATYVVLLDEEDVPEPELVDTLVRAQAASGADVVTCGLRVGDTLHFFYGEPGGLGLLSNGYGNVALYRRKLLGEVTTPWLAEGDPDWPLLASLAASGARIVSLPIPLVTRARPPGSIERNPSDALLVAQQLEQAIPNALRPAARLAAGLAADSALAKTAQPTASLRHALRRLFRRAR